MLTDQGWKHSNMVPRKVRKTFSREASKEVSGQAAVPAASVTRSPAGSPGFRKFQAWSAAWFVGAVLAGVSACLPTEALARHHAAESQASVNSTALSSVHLSSLPRQAQDVYGRILAGGPFRYAKDGIVFANRERILPRQPRGFYREYTVPIPGEGDRGPRRIVCGGKDLRMPETCFYTSDHYQSFRTIDPRR